MVTATFSTSMAANFSIEIALRTGYHRFFTRLRRARAALFAEW